MARDGGPPEEVTLDLQLVAPVEPLLHYVQRRSQLPSELPVLHVVRPAFQPQHLRNVRQVFDQRAPHVGQVVAAVVHEAGRPAAHGVADIGAQVFAVVHVPMDGPHPQQVGQAHVMFQAERVAHDHECGVLGPGAEHVVVPPGDVAAVAFKDAASTEPFGTHLCVSHPLSERSSSRLRMQRSSNVLGRHGALSMGSGTHWPSMIRFRVNKFRDEDHGAATDEPFLLPVKSLAIEIPSDLLRGSNASRYRTTLRKRWRRPEPTRATRLDAQSVSRQLVSTHRFSLTGGDNRFVVLIEKRLPSKQTNATVQ
jgi:hypothetical protein